MIDHRTLDPRAKLAVATSVTLLAVAIPSLRSLLALGLVLVVLVAVGRGLTVIEWLRFLRPFRVIVPVILLLNAFFYGGGRVIWSLPGVPLLSLTTGGLETSAVIVARLLVIAGVASWFAATTEPEAFEVALVTLGVPWSFGFLLSLTLRLVPELRDRFREIEDAQRSRGLSMTGGPLSRARARVPMFIPFLAATIEYGYELSEALAVRDFGHRRDRTSIVTLDQGPTDYAMYGLSIAMIAGFVAAFVY